MLMSFYWLSLWVFFSYVVASAESDRVEGKVQREVDPLVDRDGLKFD